jgi:SAM-dependent methyltransferase
MLKTTSLTAPPAVLPGGKLKEFAKRRLPMGIAVQVNALVTAAWTLKAAYGVFPRECNICGYRGRFVGYGRPMRIDARCTSCGALERHRLLKLWLDHSLDKIQSRDVLHFAPEPSITRVLRPVARTYVTADLDPTAAALQLDIEAIELDDQTFDVIVCSNVLEHVDDRRALAEMHRVLRPGGVALLMVPIIEGWRSTCENALVKTPRERRLYFGQEDHVRYYGSDLRRRISAVGFEVDEFTATEPFVAAYGLTRGEKLFVATRPA